MPPMPKQQVWISYDLGIQGDYESLYRWLDEHHAVECGDTVALIEFEYRQDLPRELHQALTSKVQLGPASRVYVLVGTNDGVRGGWLIGRRHRAPWEGYAVASAPGEATFGWEPDLSAIRPPKKR